VVTIEVLAPTHPSGAWERFWGDVYPADNAPRIVAYIAEQLAARKPFRMRVRRP
jgi:hypothetical protein